MAATSINKEHDADGAIKHLEAVGKEERTIHQMSHPVTVNGTTYDQVRLDFDSLTGEDMEAIANIMVAGGDITPQMQEFSKTYLLHVVSRASKININDLRKFPIRDTSKLTLLAQAFILGTD